jgi:hypothetical protein
MVHNLPVSFFGYSYAAPGTQPASGLGFLWGRCIEYVMLALVDHGPEPQPSEHEILGRYLAINGHLFLSYGLQTRADFWLSKAHEGLPSTNSGATTESHCDESTFSTGGAAVHGTNVKETEPSENEPTLLEAVLALDGPGPRIGEARRAAVDAYIGEVFRQTGKRITRTDIWKTVRYKTRTEFERWERNDPKNPNKTADARFRKILTEKPHLK